MYSRGSRHQRQPGRNTHRLSRAQARRRVALSDDGKPILEDAIMRQVLAAAARLNLPVVQHAEDCRMTTGRR